jgi:hypothetical protein
MKTAVIVLLMSILLATNCFGRDGRHRPPRHPHGTASGGLSGRYIGGGSTDQTYGTNSSTRPVYGFVLTPGREIGSTPASWGWVWVEGPSQEALKQQKARDDAFHAALEQYQKDFPWRLMPWEK